MSKPLISILTPAYNESENIQQLIIEISSEILIYKDKYDFEIIVIDNCSTDNTVQLVKEICTTDKQVKLIVNSRNFGHIKSPFYGLLQANGDSVILMASDFQDPIHLIHQHIQNWENGFLMSLAIKNNAEENWLFYNIRKLFYKTLS
ncbi:MAG: glycosyltransferase, partial [bacterium]